MPTSFACLAEASAPCSKFRSSTRALLLALGTGLTVASAGPALGIVSLDDKHEIFAISRGSQGIANSVVSVEFRYGDVTTEEDITDTEGGFRREGQASGVLLNSGQNSVWMITAGHNLAVLGRFDVDEDTSIVPTLTVGLGNNYFTTNTVSPDDWYVASGFGDSAGNLIQFNDYGLVRLDVTPAEIEAMGLTTVSIYERQTPADLISEIHGETVEIVGFGLGGNGRDGTSDFDGYRRWGQNRVEPWLDSIPRLSPTGSASFIEMDFDVDRDDDFYDLTPDDFNDRNLALEQAYAVKNFGEFILSGQEEPRQVPEEDFRIPFEAGISPGDSGGGVFLGGALVGLPISSRAVPLDTDSDGVDDEIGFGYGTDAQFITLSDQASLIENLIFFAEQAEIDFLNGDRDELLLTDNELAFLGFNYGAFDLNPIFNFDDQAETNNRRGNAVPIEPLTGGNLSTTTGSTDVTVGPEVQKSILLTSYYFGESLSPVAKAKLIGLLPLSASDDLTDAELIAIIDDAEFTTIADVVDALNSDLEIIYGQPSVGRAIRASQSLDFVANNSEIPDRNAAPPSIRDRFGDFNGDGTFDANDLDEFIEDLRNGGEWTDLNGDGLSNDLDTAVFVESLLGLLMGDANLDGFVNQTDLDAVLNGWGQNDRGWAGGNFGGLGSIDQFDLDAVLNNWGASTAPNFQGFTVPEPAALTLLGLGGLAMLRRRHA